MSDEISRTPSVAIILLNWNGWSDTAACLDSLRDLDYPSFRVFIVDNGSTDDSVARFEEWRRGKVDDGRFSLVRSAQNRGFSGGNNLGIRRALEDGLDFVWLLNNDTVVERGALSALVRVARVDDSVGAVGSLVLFLRCPETINSAGIRVTRFGRQARLIGLNEDRSDPRFNVERNVDAIAGCSMLVRTDALRRVGLMEERYFLYLEDVDLGTRLRQAGYRCVYTPESVVFHKQWGSIQAYPVLADYYLGRSQVLYVRKFSGRLHAAAAIALFAAKYIGRLLIRRSGVKKRDCLKALRLGLQHGLAGRFDYRWPT